jgi:hypothetical protein
LEDLWTFAATLTRAPATRRRTLSAIKALLSTGLKMGELRFNVGAVLRLPKVVSRRAELRLEEMQVIASLPLAPFERFVAKIAAVPRAEIDDADAVDQQKPRTKRGPKLKRPAAKPAPQGAEGAEDNRYPSQFVGLDVTGRTPKHLHDHEASPVALDLGAVLKQGSGAVWIAHERVSHGPQSHPPCATEAASLRQSLSHNASYGLLRASTSS